MFFLTINFFLICLHAYKRRVKLLNKSLALNWATNLSIAFEILNNFGLNMYHLETENLYKLRIAR